MWFVIGLLIGLSLRVEPATITTVVANESLPTWAVAVITVAAVALCGALAILSFRFGVFGSFAQARAEKTAAERNMRAAQRAYYRDVEAARNQASGPGLAQQ